MAKKQKPPKPRNPQDTTLRNLRAMKTRMKELRERVDDLDLRVTVLETPSAPPPETVAD